MSTAIKTPQLPESVNDATVITWHKQPGEHLIEDENLLDLETDKVVLEVPAPCSGILSEILQPEGSIVTADVILGKIDESAISSATEVKPVLKEPAASSNSDHAVEENTSVQASSTSLPFASPSIRQQLFENDLEESDVEGSGAKGHITSEDIEKKLSRSTSQPVPTQPGSIEQINDREERRVPMTRLRARMADRLTHAQQSTATLTTFNEIDMQAAMDIRSRHKADFETNHNVRLGFMSFFIQAACRALSKFPDINASVDGTDIIYHGYFDIGVAVSSERGLVVPIIRNADQLGMAGIEKRIVELSEKARSGKLTMDDLTGGTFSVSNGGVFGSMLSTPIINPPQSAILGMHKIEKRAVVVNDQISIRPVMFVALSYDHRLIDGKTAVQFLVTIKELIEDPARLLLDY